MRTRQYVYIGGTLVAAAIIAISAWQPLARADGDKNKNKQPTFEVDPFWPKPPLAPVGSDGFRHTWITGEVAGNCIDQLDNVYIFNRGWEVGVSAPGFPLQGNMSGAIDSQDATASSIPSPPVVAYDSEGNTIAGWGNPSLIPTTTGGTVNVDYGFAAYMPHGAHGCFVDYQGYVWVAGNGDGIVQKYNPASAQAAGASATYVAQIGTKGTCDTTLTIPPTANPFSSCGTNGISDGNTSHTLLNEPADITVDPLPDPVTGTRGSVYIADGYGNHRVVVYTTADGGQTYTYNRQWGATCEDPSNPAFATGAAASGNQACPPGKFGATGGGHPHCVVFANNGDLYVCDRPNSRIQVFDRSCGAPSTAANPHPICIPKKIINIGLNPGQTPPSSVPVIGNNAFQNTAPDGGATILTSPMLRACDIDFWPNIDYLATESPASQTFIADADANNDNVFLMDRATAIVFGTLGVCGFLPCPGHYAAQFETSHTLAVDSKGNIYVAETITGRRIQKFVPSKMVKNKDD